MKRTLMMMLLIMATMASNAQSNPTYYGYLTRNVSGYSKGEGIMYKKTRSGKIQIEDAAEFSGAFPPSIVKFSGYYIGEIVDPVDNYVNVRKGPGTSYPVVRRVHTKEWCMDHEMAGSSTDSGEFFYQKTNTNWWKLYDKPGKFVGYIYHERLISKDSPEYY